MEADSSRIKLHKASSQAGRKTEDSRKARGIRSINNKKEVKKNKEVKKYKDTCADLGSTAQQFQKY